MYRGVFCAFNPLTLKIEERMRKELAEKGLEGVKYYRLIKLLFTSKPSIIANFLVLISSC